MKPKIQIQWLSKNIVKKKTLVAVIHVLVDIWIKFPTPSGSQWRLQMLHLPVEPKGFL